MLIAHFADTHLGKKLYGIQKTMDQFMYHFEQAVELALREHVDAIVFAGDFFDESQPPNMVLRKAIDIIDKIVEKSTRVYIVAGDHDRPKRADLSPIYVLTKARVPGPDNIFIERVAKDGVEYYFTGVNNVSLRASEKLRVELSKQLHNLTHRGGRNNVLILHQNILNLFPIEKHGLTFDDIPQAPKYVAMGHLHRRIQYKRVTDKGIQLVAYPGSIDVFSKDEIMEAKTQGKGFYIVDISRDEALVQKIDIETTPFEYVESSIEESELKSKIIHALHNLSGLVSEKNKGVLYLSLKVKSSDRVNLNAVSDLISSLASKYLPSPEYIFKPKIERSFIGSGGARGEVPPRFGALSEIDVLTHILMERLGIEEEGARVLSKQIVRIKESVTNDDDEELFRTLDEISKASLWRKIGIPDNYISLDRGATSTSEMRDRTLKAWLNKG